MINRDRYLQKLISARNNGFPKVITGIRRCGKSYLLKEIYKKYLIDDGVPEEDILILELDDDRNFQYRDPVNLGAYVRQYSASRGKCYVFLDEIQSVYSLINPNLTGGKHIPAGKGSTEIISFVDAVLGLSREKNIDLYITGSNSRMLSTDIITEFRDKATNIPLSPLSFEEYYKYAGGSALEAIYEYMQFGGMPLAVLEEEDGKKAYLSNLFETTYLIGAG